VTLFALGFVAGLLSPSVGLHLAVRERNRVRAEAKEAKEAIAHAEELASEATALLLGRGLLVRVGWVQGEVVLLMRRGAA
jgi:hypothetical protein